VVLAYLSAFEVRAVVGGILLAAAAFVCITAVLHNLLAVGLSSKIASEEVVPELPFVVA